MSKSSVLQFVAALSRDIADTGTTERYYDDVAYELAKKGVITEVGLIPATHDVATYSYPDDAVDLVAVFSDNRQLTKADKQTLEWRSAGWRDRRGRSTDYVLEDETTRTFRLYPMPDVTAHDLLWSGNTMGADYPTYTLAVIFTQKRDDLPDYLDLYMALEILSREFYRESNHADATFAKACGQLAQLCLTMVLHHG